MTPCPAIPTWWATTVWPGLGRYWGNVGLANSAIGACNTFTAEDSLVR